MEKGNPALAQTKFLRPGNPAKAAAMGRAGRERAERLFAFPGFIDQTLLVYEQALQAASRS